MSLSWRRGQGRALQGRRNEGITLPEMLIVAAMGAILMLLLSRVLTRGTSQLERVDRGLRAQSEARNAMSRIEHDLFEALEITVAQPNRIQFVLDSHRLPGYDPLGDFDGDGVRNFEDHDVDGDHAVISIPANAWRSGYNIVDDDDDNDGNLDVECAYYLQGTDLMRDCNYNGAGWGQNTERVLRYVPVNGFQLSYFGSVNQPLGRNIDLGNDGVVTTPPDAGEGDGIITAREIDWVLPPRGHGNRSGTLDTRMERLYINLIRVRLVVNRKGTGDPDFVLETEVSPPLFTARRAIL